MRSGSWWVLAALVLGGCARTDAIWRAPARFSTEVQTLEVRIETLSRALRLGGNQCGQVCRIGEAVCEAAEKICEIAEEHPEEGDLPDRCQRARTQCTQARAQCRACGGGALGEGG